MRHLFMPLISGLLLSGCSSLNEPPDLTAEQVELDGKVLRLKRAETFVSKTGKSFNGTTSVFIGNDSARQILAVLKSQESFRIESDDPILKFVTGVGQGRWTLTSVGKCKIVEVDNKGNVKRQQSFEFDEFELVP